MSIFKRINQEVSKWFDSEEPITPKPTAPEPAWKNPLDSMPTANGSNKYAPPERMAELNAEVKSFSWEDTAPCEYEPPRAEEEVAEWFVEKPDESDEIEKEKTMHQKMYEMATARYTPFSLGGSENCDSDISHSAGGSENVQKL